MSDFNSTKKRIQERGYWIVNIHPSSFIKSLDIEKKELINKVRENVVSLRGWDYPHCSIENDKKQETYLIENRAESWIDWDVFKEIWRFYTNRQFIHFFCIYNDWYEEMKSWGDISQYKKIKPMTQLDFVEVIYRLTEILQFVKNLYSNKIFDSDIVIKISLHNLKNRYLMTLNEMRVFNSNYYQCRGNEIRIEKKVTKSEIIENSNSMALDIAGELFSDFQWTTFPKNGFRDEQDKLINRQLV